MQHPNTNRIGHACYHVITFPCRCRGVGRPRRERVDAHFRHRFIRCPCRCRGLGRPRREKVDAQSHTNKQVNSLFCDRGSDQRAASSICLTKEIRLAAADSPWPSNANIALHAVDVSGDDFVRLVEGAAPSLTIIRSLCRRQYKTH